MLPDDVVVDLPFALGAVLLAGVVIYAVTGGADFGGGIWDLLARGQARPGAAAGDRPGNRPDLGGEPRLADLRDRAHLHLFPARVRGDQQWRSTCRSRLILVGITLRGAAFIFRAYAHDVVCAQRNWGAVFAVSSALTPMLFGMCAGAVASGDIRVVDGEVAQQLTGRRGSARSRS